MTIAFQWAAPAGHRARQREEQTESAQVHPWSF
jgi:hypothetical protein